MDVTQLLDRQAVVDLLTRYTRAVDTGDFADLAHVFTEDAVLDYSSPGGPVGPPAEVVPWIQQGLAGFARTQHVIGQISFEQNADVARATAYFTNPMVSLNPDGTEKLWEVGGYYHLQAVRTEVGWRLSGLTDDIVWTRGF